MQIYFLYPLLLFLLLLVPIFILLYFASMLYNKKKSVSFPNFEAMARISDVEVFSKDLFFLYLNIGIVLLVVLAVAGTSISFYPEVSSFSYVFVIDSSSSMRVSDISPSRLSAAKSFSKDLCDLLPLVEIGVVSFSGDANILQELEASKLKVKMAIDSIGFGDVQGTNVYNALIAANKVFGSRNLKSVILVSDGQLNVKEIVEVIDYAQKRNLVLNTIAVGTEEGGLTEFSTISKVDEDALKSLSFNTGGKFFRVYDAEGFDEVIFDLSEKVDKSVSLNLSIYLLLAALVLLFLNWILYNFRFKSIP